MAFSDDEIFESFQEHTNIEKYAGYDFKDGYTIIHRAYYKPVYNIPIPKIKKKEYQYKRNLMYMKLRYYFKRAGLRLPLKVKRELINVLRKEFEK